MIRSNARPAFRAHGPAESGVRQQLADGFSDGGRIAGRDDKTRLPIADELAVAAAIGGNDRQARGHVLEDGVGQTFVRARHQRACAAFAEKCGHVGNISQEGHLRRKSLLRNERLQARPLRAIAL